MILASLSSFILHHPQSFTEFWSHEPFPETHQALFYLSIFLYMVFPPEMFLLQIFTWINLKIIYSVISSEKTSLTSPNLNEVDIKTSLSSFPHFFIAQFVSMYFLHRKDIYVIFLFFIKQ